MQRVREAWEAHYEPIKHDIRPGCEPRLMLQEGPSRHSVVLLHGLTDSPYYMTAIGQRFFEAGSHVFIPLLPAHGLVDPRHMAGVHLDQWLGEVDFAVEQARALSKTVSLGGLSTGGTLSLHKAITSPGDIEGCLFLFSAALDLSGRWGDLKERMLRMDALIDMLSAREDRSRPSLIGANPYKYARMDLDGAGELSDLIHKIEAHYASGRKYADIAQPIFVAHSENDEVADIGELDVLVANHPRASTDTYFFRIEKARGVPHASVVLDEDIVDSETNGELGTVLEAGNPLFDAMMNEAIAFMRRHV